MPPMMPQSLTRNCHRGMCCSVTLTISELISYFIKIPETPWLPAAWFITRSCGTAKGIQMLSVQWCTIYSPAKTVQTQTYPLSDGVLMRVCRHFVGVQFGWHNGDEVLKHVVSWKEASRAISGNKSLSEHFNNKQFNNIWNTNLQSIAIFSVPSRGLIIPGSGSPKDRWSIRWEKL